MNKRLLIYTVLIPLVFACQSNSVHTLLFIGSFTEGKPAAGIHVYKFDNESGKLKFLHHEPNTINPSFLKISSDGGYLYSVLESQLPTEGKVGAFKVDCLTGKLKLLSAQDCGGRNPAHIALHPKKRLLVVSNYTDAGISLFKINENGSLRKRHQLFQFNDSSIVKGRQDAAHLHSTHFSPDGQFLFGQDLGADKIRAYKVMDTDSDYIWLQPSKEIPVKPGSGPRHFTFHPNGKFGYGVSELSGKVTVFNYTEDGNLIFLEDYLSYSSEQKIYRAADIHISPDGKFLYASNRGPKEDSIAIFSINQKTGKLVLVGHESTYGEHPRNFVIDPSGKFLLVANQFSDNVVVFKRNLETGTLTKLAQEIDMENPSSLQMYTYKMR